MANTTFLGHAPNQKQIATLAVGGTWVQGDTITITVNGLDLVFTVGATVTTTGIATGVKEAFNGTTLTDTTASCQPTIAQSGGQAVPGLRVAAATVSSSTVSFTAVVTGATGSQTEPFTFSATKVSTSGTVTYTNAATAHKGKHDATDADNWSAGAVLADNDAVFFLGGDVGIYDNLAVTCQPLTISKSKAYTGRVGRFSINKFNNQSIYHYPEYRSLYFTTDDNTVTTTANLEIGEGQGSGLFMWDAGAGQVLLNLFGQGQRYVEGVPCVLFKGSHASNEVNNVAGDLGVAWFEGETAVIANLQTGNGPTSLAETVCKSGVTLTTIVCNGGYLSTDSAFTTGTQYNGTWEHGLGTGTTLNVLGGVFYPIKNATITTLTVGSSGEFNATKGTDPFVITQTIQLYKGAKFIDPQGRAGNVVFKLNQCSPEDVKIVLPPNKTYTLS